MVNSEILTNLLGFEHVRVGTGLMIVKDNSQVLLGKRKGSHGEGEYSWPGGHMDKGETMVEAVVRELHEECGWDLVIETPTLLRISDLLEYWPKQYVDIGFVAKYVSGEPQVMEPHKLESWGWYDIDNLPSPLFATIPGYIESYKNGTVGHYTYLRK